MPRKRHEESQYRCACDWAALPMYTNLQEGRKEGGKDGRKEVRKERRKERRRKKRRMEGGKEVSQEGTRIRY